MKIEYCLPRRVAVSREIYCYPFFISKHILPDTAYQNERRFLRWLI